MLVLHCVIEDYFYSLVENVFVMLLCGVTHESNQDTGFVIAQLPAEANTLHNIFILPKVAVSANLSDKYIVFPVTALQ